MEPRLPPLVSPSPCSREQLQPQRRPATAPGLQEGERDEALPPLEEDRGQPELSDDRGHPVLRGDDRGDAEALPLVENRSQASGTLA